MAARLVRFSTSVKMPQPPPLSPRDAAVIASATDAATAADVESTRTYLVGTWLTDSNAVRRGPLAQRSFAQWLVQAWTLHPPAGGTGGFHRWAVARTLHRWMHRDRRRNRGMAPVGSPLLDRLPQFAALYGRCPEVALATEGAAEDLRAFLQLRDAHTWTRAAADAACYVVCEEKFPEVCELLREACAQPSARQWPLTTMFNGVPGHVFVYALALDESTPREIARTIVGGVRLAGARRRTRRPRRVHGRWPAPAKGQRGHAGAVATPFARLVAALEYNSYLPRHQRYRVPPGPPARNATSRRIWVVWCNGPNK